jgi:uncharacterized protein (DUF2235 family)
MALYAFDGTGKEDEGDVSNVLEFFRGYRDDRKNNDPEEQLGSLYLKGIGTRAETRIGDAAAQAFGLGGHKRVRQALDRLENNQAAEDTAIHIVGFSRGAALALSFANEIAHKYASLPVAFIGLWDVVGQFGVPGHFINAGHDLRMPRNAQRVFHAIALDESRAFFPLTRLSSLGKPDDARLTEVWFRGVHSDVGGGNGNATLNWIALHWMFQNALRCGLPIDPAAVQANLARRVDPPRINDHSIDAQIPRHCRAGDILHVSVTLNEGEPGRPHNNPSVQVRRIDDDGVFA